MNKRIDELIRLSLFFHPSIQDKYELDIMSDQMARNDYREFMVKTKTITQPSFFVSSVSKSLPGKDMLRLRR